MLYFSLRALNLHYRDSREGVELKRLLNQSPGTVRDY